MKKTLLAFLLCYCSFAQAEVIVGTPRFAMFTPLGELVIITETPCNVPEVGLRGKQVVAYSKDGSDFAEGCIVAAEGKVYGVFRKSSGEPAVIDFTGAPFKKLEEL